jgi:demethylmenaquinone methyltransferase/2-methoxy-6-polyprenyl-1,4-benzoquinol methylase
MEPDKGRAVRAMFGSIAGRYDLLNHLLSGNVDRLWRRAAVAEIRRRVRGARILDLGCGTADLTLALSGSWTVIGCDFSLPMLDVGRRKLEGARPPRPALVAGDALDLPFRSGAFDAVVSAFVVRNLADLPRGLAEMRRVLARGGILGILDFSMPDGVLVGPLFRFYFTRVLPVVGKWVSGVDGPYRYLPESVRTVPAPERLAAILVEAGFERAERRALTGGIAVLYSAVRRE